MASNEELMDTSEINTAIVSQPNAAMMSSEILNTTGSTVITQQHTLVSEMPMTADDMVTRPEKKDRGCYLLYHIKHTDTRETQRERERERERER